MSLFFIAEKDGLNPKRVSSKIGGEYHSPCPNCFGHDRFIIWEQQGRYYCRQCQKTGDIIQYFRDFHNMSYADACIQAGMQTKQKSESCVRTGHSPSTIKPHEAIPPLVSWQQKARILVDFCKRELKKNQGAMKLLSQRGFSWKTLEIFELGWNPETLWLHRTDWSLSATASNKLWVPKGLLIPTLDIQKNLIKLKIRRSNWHEGDKLPKYVEIQGSMQSPSIYGDPSEKPFIVMESELDAILVQQNASDLCCSMALGGASKRPDLYSHQLLMRAPFILFSCDMDMAGANALKWWRQNYPKLKVWVPPMGKSIGDAYQAGLNLEHWLKSIGMFNI